MFAPLFLLMRLCAGRKPASGAGPEVQKEERAYDPCRAFCLAHREPFGMGRKLSPLWFIQNHSTRSEGACTYQYRNTDICAKTWSNSILIWKKGWEKKKGNDGRRIMGWRTLSKEKGEEHLLCACRYDLERECFLAARKQNAPPPANPYSFDYPGRWYCRLFFENPEKRTF